MEDDKSLFEEIRKGKLDQVLDRLPRERWLECSRFGFANKWLEYQDPYDLDRNANAVRRLVLAGVSLFVFGEEHMTTILHVANPKLLDIICPIIPNLQLKHEDDTETALEFNLRIHHYEYCRILIKHGARLPPNPVPYHTPVDLVIFQRSILSCRSAVVAFLTVKRKGKLANWDKFLLAYIARLVWTTRCDDGWVRDDDFADYANLCNLQCQEEHLQRQITLLRAQRSVIERIIRCRN